mgnify:CR=1 FL=1
MSAANWRNSGAITEDTIFAVHPVIAALAMTCMDALMQRLHGCNGAAHAPAAYVHPVIAALAHDVHGRTNAAFAWMQWSCSCARGIRTSCHRRSCHDVHGRTNAAFAWMQWSCPCARGIRTSCHRRSCASMRPRHTYILYIKKGAY